MRISDWSSDVCSSDLKLFTIVSCSAMSQEIVDMLGTDEETRKLLSGTPNAFSGIYGPDGRLLTEPLIDEEGIAYAEIDLDRCIEPKQYHDIIGHYNRFDIFKLSVDRGPQAAEQLQDDAPHAQGETEEADPAVARLDTAKQN